MTADGTFTQKARLDIQISPFEGDVFLQVLADYMTQFGAKYRKIVFHARLNPKESRAVAKCIRELADGNIGEFEEAGITFEADEWGYSFFTPSGREIWFEEEADLRAMADGFEKAAKEATE